MMAADALERRGLSGHFFVTVNYIGTPGFVTKTRCWSNSARRGHRIGSHSCSHPLRMGHCAWSAARPRVDPEPCRAERHPVAKTSRPGRFPAAISRRASRGLRREAGYVGLFTSEPTQRYAQCSWADPDRALRDPPMDIGRNSRGTGGGGFPALCAAGGDLERAGKLMKRARRRAVSAAAASSCFGTATRCAGATTLARRDAWLVCAVHSACDMSLSSRVSVHRRRRDHVRRRAGRSAAAEIGVRARSARSRRADPQRPDLRLRVAGLGHCRHGIRILPSAAVPMCCGTLATTDPLTNLLNRRAIESQLESEWERARRYGLPLSLLMIDLDGFKRVNDLGGHAAGDRVLRAPRQRFAARCARATTARAGAATSS